MRPQHRKFVHEYIKNGFNGVQAVYAAGYKQGYESACVQSSRLLRSAKVKQMVDDHLKEAKMSADEVALELSSIARKDTDIGEASKLKALDLLTKIHGMQVQKIESSSTVTTIDPASIQRSIDRICAKTSANPRDVALQLQQEWSDKSDPDYSPELHQTIQEIVNSLPVEQIAEQITEIGDQ